jgi:hypothetical protein
MRQSASFGRVRHPASLPPSLVHMAHPALLPATTEQGQAARKWQPSKYTQPPQPPPQDEARQREIEMATARQLQDGKALKKIRPRRTVDYGGSMGRWILVSMFRIEHGGVSSNPQYSCESSGLTQHIHLGYTPSFLVSLM